MVVAQTLGGIISIFLSAFFLWLVVKIFKLKDNSFGMALKIAALVGIIGMVLNYFLKGALSLAVLAITLVLGVALVKKYHELGWGKSCAVSFVWLAVSITATMLVAFVLGMLLVGMGFASMAG